MEAQEFLNSNKEQTRCNYNKENKPKTGGI